MSVSESQSLSQSPSVFDRFLAALLWVLYIALEPFVRRRWPQILVSWTRLLSGEWRDPLVACNVLVGCAFGVLIHCIRGFAFRFVPSWFGYAEFDPLWPLFSMPSAHRSAAAPSSPPPISTIDPRQRLQRLAGALLDEFPARRHHVGTQVTT